METEYLGCGPPPPPPTYLPRVNEYGRNTQTSNIDPIPLSAHTRENAMRLLQKPNHPFYMQI